MTGFVQKDGTGAIFINRDKKTDKHPDRTGSLVLDGRRYRIAGWVKVSGKGEQFLSIKVEPETPRSDAVDKVVKAVEDNFGPGARVREGRHLNFSDDLDDTIPFAPEFR